MDSLVIAELLDPVLVEAEVVGELVEDGDPDLPLELVRVRKRLDERAAEDRDLVRHVLVGLPEAEEVGVGRILLLDDDGDVLERARDLRRQVVERAPDVLLEGAGAGRHVGLSGRRTATARTVTKPKTKPPTWAKNATPAPASGCVMPKPPAQSCRPNQTPRKRNAGIGMGKIPTSVRTRAVGRSMR